MAQRLDRQTSLGLLGCAAIGLELAGSATAQDASPEAVVAAYADNAQAIYEDSLRTAKSLEQEIAAFLDSPGEDGLRAARDLPLRQRHRR